jgi:hypothetical protein
MTGQARTVPDLFGEIWKPIYSDYPGFPDYRVSNLGRVKRIAAPRKFKSGFAIPGEHLLKATNAEVSLKDRSGKFVYCQVGRLVLQSFVRDPPNVDSKARHLDDNRKDSSLLNLDWGSQADNVHDAVRNGRFIRGPISDETRSRMRAWQRGRKHSDQTLKKMSESGVIRHVARKAAGLVHHKSERCTVLGLIWITDGSENRYFSPDDKMPDGWRTGRTIKTSSNFTKSTSGTSWINNGEKNLRLKIGSQLPDGYRYGRMRYEKGKE